MLIGNRIRRIRETLNLSQGDLQAGTGLFRCYISRVENGYTVPSVETLEKIATAFQLPLYRLFWEESDPQPKTTKDFPPAQRDDWATSGSGEKQFRNLRKNLAKIDDKHRALLLALAQRVTRPSRTAKASGPT
jgi:transcriptional regulator with XRE-family HTH domain